MVLRVEYRRAGASRQAEVSDRTYATLDMGGGEVFWAEKMQIMSSTDASNYRVEGSGAFFVDGVEIHVAAGDTLPAIAAKINDSAAPVKAFIDPETRGLALEGTNAHLIRLEDRVGDGPHVLRDLGIIVENADTGAANWHPNARVAGSSAFDMVIRLRDSFLRGDQEFSGSQGILGIDLALTNIQTRLAEVGSRYERAQMTWARINEEIPRVSASLAREAGISITDAATDLSQMEFAHKATLQTAAKLLPPSLLDFLR